MSDGYGVLVVVSVRAVFCLPGKTKLRVPAPQPPHGYYKEPSSAIFIDTCNFIQMHT